MSPKTLFVTVGTTSFDKLIQRISSEECLEILASLGFRNVVLQIGRGKFVPSRKETDKIRVDFFRYKDSIAKDIQVADLVISHAGAGSCLEVLGARKPLVVVINDDLMNNHQMELAQKLHRDGHLYYTTCCELEQTLRTADFSKLRPLDPGQPEKFASFLDRIMGIS